MFLNREPIRSIPLIVALGALSGCSSSDDGKTPGPGSGLPETLIPELAPPERGFQVRSKGTTIAVGEDVEYCEIATLPGTPDQSYYIEGYEVAMTELSHHLIVSAILTGSKSEASWSDGQREPCFGAQELLGFGESVIVTGAQVPRVSYRYPETVGKVFTGGQKLVFDYHYLNTSDSAVPARHAVNFIETDAAKIERIAYQLAFVNLTIDTPARSQATFTGECSFDQDIMVGAITRHTHKWGKDFDAWFAGGDRDQEHIWTSKDYELDTTHRFDPPILMKAGTGFRFECDFDNTTDQPLVFGEKATDEMCILFGTWWVVASADPVTPQFCVMNSVDPDGVSRGTKDLPF